MYMLFSSEITSAILHQPSVFSGPQGIKTCKLNQQTNHCVDQITFHIPSVFPNLYGIWEQSKSSYTVSAKFTSPNSVEIYVSYLLKRGHISDFLKQSCPHGGDNLCHLGHLAAILMTSQAYSSQVPIQKEGLLKSCSFHYLFCSITRADYVHILIDSRKSTQILKSMALPSEKEIHCIYLRIGMCLY